MRRLYVSYRDRSGAKQDGGKDVKVTISYSPLREALKHRWSGVPRRQTKNLNPAAVFIILGRDSTRSYLTTGCSHVTALWEFQSIRQGHLPDDPIYADELEAIANSLIAKAEVNKEAFPAIPRVVVECVLFNFQFRLYPRTTWQNDGHECNA
jgi:ubiquitin-like 1-activating enzyme E1 A